MESRASIKRSVKLGKTVSPRPTKLKAWAYKDFKIGELFSAQTGDTDLQQKDINGKGTYFINSGVEGYGIKGKTDRKAKVFEANTISIDFWGNAYYRDFKYKMATHNHVFSLSGNVIKNRNVGLYLVSTMSYMTKVFSYNNMGTWSKIKEMLIHLPVTHFGTIDFDFMEARIQELETARIQELDAYLNVEGYEDCSLSDEEQKSINANIEYKLFDIVKEFDVVNSHNILKSDVVFGSGTTPYVTACEGNNSIVSYITYNDDLKEKGNSIMIGGKTLVITYQPNDFFSNDSHNLVLTINDIAGRTENAQLFMVTALYKSLSPKYSWGDSISKTKIQKDKVWLPVDKKGCIDFNYMETYIRAIMKQTIGKLKSAMGTEPDNIQIDEYTYELLDNVSPSQRFTTHLPVFPLRAACGNFDECGKLQNEDAEGWIDASGLGRTLNDKMFVVHAEGDSMEPKIHDGELCVFDASGAGSREGKIVLTKAKDKSDSRASSFTIKKYHSEKVAAEEGGWSHSQITLSPLNPDYKPIVINAEETDADDFRIYGEYVGKI